jgi:chemotaxis protein methyltransferase CheR
MVNPLDPPDLDEAGAVEDFFRLVAQIETRTRFQGRFYKDKCLRRRIAVRMRARGEESFAGYAALLDRDPREYDLLLDALTINVTKFFRNAPVWEAIEERVVPALFERPAPVRIWSAGCASGEEAYSVSILLREWAARHGRARELDRFGILGTDIDRRSLDAARRAEFPELSLDETPPERRERWFSAPGPPFRLHDEARRNVDFLHRDLISGPAEKGQSLIVCRNVIIYFDRRIQEELFQRFHDALLPGGFLVLGKVETLLGRARSLLRTVSTRERIFQRPE